MLSLSIIPQKILTYDLDVYLINEEDFFDALKITIVYREIDSLEEVRTAVCKAYNKNAKSMQFYIYDKSRCRFAHCQHKMNELVLSLNIQKHEMLLLVADKQPLDEYADCVLVWFDMKFNGWDSSHNIDGLFPFKIFHFQKKVKIETLYSMVYRWIFRTYYYRPDDFYRKFSRGMNGFEQESRPFDLIMGKKVLEFNALSQDSEEIELQQEQIIIHLNDVSSLKYVDLYAVSIRECRDPVVISQMSIKSCLDILTAQNFLDEQNRWKCGKCLSFEKALVNLSLKKLPEILIIHLKRFKQTEHGDFDKVTSDIEFPFENFDLANYVDSPLAGENTRFDLYATINHRGSLQRGHYIAFVRHFTDQKWYKFDDDLVSEVQDPCSSFTDQPYILFFRKHKSK